MRSLRIGYISAVDNTYIHDNEAVPFNYPSGCALVKRLKVLTFTLDVLYVTIVSTSTAGVGVVGS